MLRLMKRRIHDGHVEKTNLIFPSEIKKEAIRFAQKKRLSLSQWIVSLVEAQLEKEKEKKV